MTQDEYDAIALYTRGLTARRITHPDKQVLDECQVFLEAFCKNAEENGFEAPPAAGPPVNVTAPYVAGTGAVGSTLVSTMGTWTQEPYGYAYEWWRDDVALGTTGENYLVVDEDNGHNLTCVVIATNALGTARSPSSNVVAVTAGLEAHTAAVLNRLRDDLLTVMQHRP